MYIIQFVSHLPSNLHIRVIQAKYSTTDTGWCTMIKHGFDFAWMLINSICNKYHQWRAKAYFFLHVPNVLF